jgi:hypothetical protein
VSSRDEHSRDDRHITIMKKIDMVDLASFGMVGSARMGRGLDEAL